MKKANSIDIKRLAMFKAELGEMNSDEALNIAVEFESTMKAVGPFDIAFQYFSEMKHKFEKYAEILERCGE